MYRLILLRLFESLWFWVFPGKLGTLRMFRPVSHVSVVVHGKLYLKFVVPPSCKHLIGEQAVWFMTSDNIRITYNFRACIGQTLNISYTSFPCYMEKCPVPRSLYLHDKYPSHGWPTSSILYRLVIHILKWIANPISVGWPSWIFERIFIRGRLGSFNRWRVSGWLLCHMFGWRAMVLQLECTAFVCRVLLCFSPSVGSNTCEDEEDKVNDPGSDTLVT